MKDLIKYLLTGICLFGFNQILAQTPPNDVCNNAFSIYCPGGIDMPIVNATATDALSPCQGPPGSGILDASPGVWFKFYGTGDTITLSTDNSDTDFDTELQLFRGNCGALTCIGGDDNSGLNYVGGLTSVIEFLSELDSTYYLYVDGDSSAVGYFHLTMQCECDPPVFTYSIDSSQLCANMAFDVHVDVSDLGTADAAYVYTIPSSSTAYLSEPGMVILDYIPIYFDGLLVVMDYYDQSCADTVTLTSPVVCPPDHDMCIDAISLICGEGQSHHTTYASSIGAPSVCTGPPGSGSLDVGPGVWHTFSGSGDSMILSTDHAGTNFDTELQLYKGTCSVLTCVGGDDNSGSGNTSELRFLSEDNVDYYLYVDGNGGSTGDYELSLNCVCVPPIYTIEVDSLCSGSQFEITVNISELGSASTVNLTNSVHGYSRNHVEIGTYYMGSYPPGTTGYIYITSVGDPACQDSISFITPPGCRPDNDLCDDAEYFYCNESVFGQIDFATAYDEPASCAGPPGDGAVTSGAGVWFQFEGTGDSMTLSTDHVSTDFDTEIQLFRGTCNNMICVGADDNSGNNSSSALTFYSQADTNYMVYLTGAGSAIGNFELSLTCICVPPTFTLVIDSICYGSEFRMEAYVTNLGSAKYVDGTNSVNSYSFNNRREGSHFIGYYDPDDQGYVYVFDDADPACIDSVLFELPGGCRPDNDLCQDAEFMYCLGVSYGTTLFSSANGYPGTCSGPPGSGMLDGSLGVWYTFNGTGESMTLSTDHPGTNYDTEIQLYKGACENLICIGGDDNGGSDSTSTLTFLSELDSIYYAYITGNNNQTGDFELSLSCDCVPATFLAYPAGCPGNYELHVNILDLGPVLNYDGVNMTNSVNSSSSLGGTGEGVTVLSGFNANDSGYVYVWGYAYPDCIDSLFFRIPDQCTPQHDVCNEAIFLSCGSQYIDSTHFANEAEAFAACQGASAGDSTDVSKGVWFVFQGTGHDMIISTDNPGTNFNTELQLFEGYCENLNCIAGDDDGGSGLTSTIQFTSERYTDYYVYLDGHGAAVGNYNLTIECVCQTASALVFAECFPDLVLTVEVSDLGSAFDLLVSNNVGSQTHLISYEQDVYFDDLLPNDSGEIYLMDNDDSSCIDTLSFTLPAACPPVNDRCKDAIRLDCGELYADSTHHASSVDLDSICPNMGESIEFGAGVWFEFYGTGDSMTITTDNPGTNFNTELILYKGYSCNQPFICLAANDDGGSNGSSRIKFLSETDNYFIYLDGNMNDFGNYEISLICDRPENDSCHLATVLTVDSFGSCSTNQMLGTLLAATPDVSSCDENDDYGVWYSFVTGPSQTKVFIHYGGEESYYDLDIEILDACNGTSLFCSRSSNAYGQLIFDVDPSTEYKILVFSDQSLEEFSICIEDVPPPPINDVCGDAIELACGDLIVSNTVLATELDVPMICQGPLGNGDVYYGNAGVWYSFIGTGDTMTALFDPLITDFDAELALFIGSCSSLTCLGSDNIPDGQSTISFLSIADSTYYLYVQGKNDVRGSFGLRLTCRCPASLSLSGMTPGDRHYETGGSLTSTQTILAGDVIDYDAGLEVELLPDFEVQFGAVFHAYIDGCDNTGNRQQVKNKQVVSELKRLSNQVPAERNEQKSHEKINLQNEAFHENK